MQRATRINIPCCDSAGVFVQHGHIPRSSAFLDVFRRRSSIQVLELAPSIVSVHASASVLGLSRGPCHSLAPTGPGQALEALDPRLCRHQLFEDKGRTRTTAAEQSFLFGVLDRAKAATVFVAHALARRAVSVRYGQGIGRSTGRDKTAKVVAVVQSHRVVVSARRKEHIVQ